MVLSTRRTFGAALLVLALILPLLGVGSARADATPPSIQTLPRVAWEGGSSYWSRFPKAADAGWDQSDFFPVVVWYGSCLSAAQMAYDKTYGVNTYAQCNQAAKYDDIDRADMFTLFPTTGQPSDAVQTRQVGTLLDDEVDGRYEPADGLAVMRERARDNQHTGRFGYANWTSGIVTYDRSMAFSAAYYDTADVNSLDQYFYSVPHCTDLPLRWRTPARSSASSGQPGTTIDRSDCRTSSSYGKMIDLQLEVNAARGKQAPTWAVLETVGIGDTRHSLLNRQQVEGMAMSSLIHEARGLVWFSQSFDDEAWSRNNPCGSGDSFASTRLYPTTYPCRDAMAGVASVGALVQRYAKVLNTQSYVWDFGPGTDTMLKVSGGMAYIFAMSDGTPGRRTFTVPGGLTDQVWMVDANETTKIVNGTFSDTFANESSYHIYAIPLKTRVTRR